MHTLTLPALFAWSLWCAARDDEEFSLSCKLESAFRFREPDELVHIETESRESFYVAEVAQSRGFEVLL